MDAKNTPLVTVVVPVYNGERYVIEALRSIKNQTYKNFDCHIVNNASTDKTEELVSDFVKNDSRFTLHTFEEFLDVGDNWNRTVHYISENAKYFKVVQADDIIFPESLESHIRLMEKYLNAGIASAYRMSGNRLSGEGLDYFKGNCWNGKEMLIKHLKGEVSVVHSNTQLLFRVEHLKKLSFYPQIFNTEDLHFDNRLAYEMFFISDLAFDFKILSLTRRHPDSITSSTVKRINTGIHGRENSLNWFKQYFPELKKDYSRVRRKYAYFLFINHLMMNKKCVQWHKENLKRKIEFSEFLMAVFWENVLARLLFRIKAKYF